MNASTLFSLQGYLRLGEILPNNKLGPLRWVGNMPEAKLALSTQTTDKSESYTGQRNQIGRLTTGKTAVLNMTFDEWSSANLALAFQATETDVTNGTATGERFPSGLVNSDVVRLDHAFATALQLTDSATPPATVPNANYRVIGHSDALVELLDVGNFTQPFKAAYSYAAVQNIAMFSQIGRVVYGLFDGINTETGEPVLIDLWRLRFDPAKELDLITKDYGSLQMSAAVLFDRSRAPDPLFGGFGRMQQRQTA